MEQIALKKITKLGRRISYEFGVSEGLSQFFTGKPFWIEYNEDIESVPDAVAAVTFVCNVLPIVWLANCRLQVSELDEAFYKCIPEVKSGYEKMYPESNWGGEICIDRVVGYDCLDKDGNCAFFYSGGVDSMHTLISHLSGKPALLSIWGADIKVDNEIGWGVLHRGINEAVEQYQLPDVVIRSSFREFDKEEELDARFSKQLRDGWWHGVKHGIALLGHIAPYAYLHNLKKFYIASSHCAENGKVRCASNPMIDNHVRMCHCSVIHDGFEYSRQDKIRNIVNYAHQHGPITLHVCWKSQTGKNCCECEKCYRTIIVILLAGGNPANFGFDKYGEFLKKSYQIVYTAKHIEVMHSYWTEIKKTLKIKKNIMRKRPEWNDIKWILDVDFDNYATKKNGSLLKIKKWIKKRFMNLMSIFTD